MKKEEKRVGWWDEECERKKKEVRMELRKWRRNKGDKSRYREKKRDYR